MCPFLYSIVFLLYIIYIKRYNIYDLRIPLRYMAEILPIQRKTLSNQSINYTDIKREVKL